MIVEPAPVRAIDAGRPLRWLALGWRDFTRAPLPSAVHGVLFLAAGALIAAIGWGRHSLLASAFSGFLLVAPMLATGLYEVSRRLARGETPTLADVATVWLRGRGAMARFGVLLALAGTAWVVLSSLIILGVLGAEQAGVGEFVLRFVLSGNSLAFALWLAAGGLFAAIVFALAAVSVPMMLDREVGIRTAALTSVRAVGANPVPMFVWAALVMTLTLASVATVLPMVVLVPVIGHATWHAYVDVVDASQLPPRV